MTIKEPLIAKDTGGHGKSDDHYGHDEEPPAIELSEKLAKFNHDGLTSSQAAELLIKWGRNELVERKTPLWELIMRYFWGDKIYQPNPIVLVMWIASIISAAVQDWADFGVVIGLIIINGAIAWYETAKAGNAVAALRAALSPKAFARRDGQWGHVDAGILVPGDMIALKIGDIIPADCILCAGGTMDVDQSGLTGESLPVEKHPGELVYSGTTVKRGELEAFVEATGENSEFGKTAKLIQSVENQGNFQKVLARIAYFLISIALAAVICLIVVDIVVNKNTVALTFQNGLILLVATVPVGQVVVCTATMAVGARRLALNNAVVTRLSAIEELAGMTILCSDKTGTLTQNILTMDTPWVTSSDIKNDDVIFCAALACKRIDPDAIDTCVVKFCPNPDQLANFEQVEFIPFDPSNRKTQSTVRNLKTGELFKVCKGAPNSILAVAHNRAEIETATQATISDFARRGLRSIAVARTLPGSTTDEWYFMGILSLFDPPRIDTKEVIENALAKGVSVKMITGDHLLIAKETARRLGMGTNILQSKSLHDKKDRGVVADLAVQVDGFAEVFPEDKFDIVAMIQEKGHVTGMTGDGVNDAPALKKAHVGFAVHGATPAAQGAASVVLSSPGLSVIITAITRSRKIFQRMNNYVVYRINVSFNLLIFFLFSITVFNFNLPSILILLMALLNDFTVMSIAYDKVFPADTPDRWRIPVIAVQSVVLAAVCAGAEIVMLVLMRNNIGACPAPMNLQTCQNLNFFNQPRLLDSQIRSAMYLQISLLLQATVFIARTQSFFFSRRPGFVLLFAVLTEMGVSTLLAIFWPGQPYGDNTQLWGCGGPWAGIVFLYSFFVLILVDIVKIVMNKVIANVTTRDKAAVEKLQEEIRRTMAAKKPALR